jgi:hypothetical protein
VDITADTPTVPVQTAFRSAFVGFGVTGAVTGYGCNLNNAGHNGRKQYAFFTTSSPSAPSGAAILSFYEPAGSPSLCCGDDGGPFFIKNGSVWEVAGVAQAPATSCPNTTLPATQDSWFTRTGNVLAWIQNPAENIFDGTGFLLNKRSNKCANGLQSTIPTQRTCDGHAQSIDTGYWRVTSTGPGIFTLANARTNRCLTAEGTSTALRTCGGAGQLWSSAAVAGEPDFVWLVNRTGTCLSVTNNGTQDGAVLTQATCDLTPGADPSQNWLFAL